jgi:hypothetical protein
MQLPLPLLLPHNLVQLLEIQQRVYLLWGKYLVQAQQPETNILILPVQMHQQPLLALRRKAVLLLEILLREFLH